ncbi:MAG: signal recognition particle receptor subunit alpha [Clostridiales bacterium]|nr:MAG: signal recognition particle receptor subunit alpha [Clostridiales bacterium]
MKEVKRALLEADVNFKVVKDFINGVSEKGARSKRSRKPHTGTAGYKNCKRRALRSYGKRNRKTRFFAQNHRHYDGGFAGRWKNHVQCEKSADF